MKLVIISGLSGSGKTIALHTLEDEDYYCVDNLPLGLLTEFVERSINSTIQSYENIAVGIDARSESNDLREFSGIIRALRDRRIAVEVIYLHTELATLIKRFSETRRKHPLTRKGLPLPEAIEKERDLLGEVAADADLFLDTTSTNVNQLRDIIRERVIGHNSKGLSVLFQSFGFKHGTPTDSDYVFDVRCLPNPYWIPKLRPLTGKDSEVAEFLSNDADVRQMQDYIRNFLKYWVPRFEQQSRYYLTISIGCTGGQHRSVYLVERLCDDFRDLIENVSVRHRELG